MKSLNIIMASALALSAAAAFAGTEKMIVTTADGKTYYDITEQTSAKFTTVDGTEMLSVNGTAVAPVSSITSISFVDQSTMPFTVIGSNDDILGAYEEVPSVLRVNPAETGQPTQFAFGTVKATEASQLPEGEWGVQLTMSQLALNAGGIADLTADADAYTLKLYRYEGGQAVDSLNEVTAGAVTYNWVANRRTLALNIDATFKGGTRLHSEYRGAVTDVTSLDEMVPAAKYGNEMIVIQPGTTDGVHRVIESVELYTTGTTSPCDLKFVFNVKDYWATCEIQVQESEVVNKGDIDMKSCTGKIYTVTIDQMQYRAPDFGRFFPKEGGTLRVDRFEDGTYEIFLDTTNLYDGFGFETGTREHFILHYKGAVE